jgi:hypothetical protein
MPRCSLRGRSGARHARDTARGSRCLPSPIPCVARRGVALPGRGGKAGVPIEPESWGCDTAAWTRRIALGIERDDGDRRPVSGPPAPASWVAFPRIFIDRMAGPRAEADPGRHDVAPGDVADATMAMLVVVPLRKPNCPLPRGVQVGKPFRRKLRPIPADWAARAGRSPSSGSFPAFRRPNRLTRESAHTNVCQRVRITCC